MPTRPTPPDPSGTQAAGANAFAGLGAGLDFFQDWMKAASSALPNLGGGAPGSSPSWSMPTLDPEELDKRIKDLKTVQFWLEQNARMIGMTIQTLEVQRMTLNTLREMKVPVDALKEAMKAQVPGAQPGPATDSAAPGVNPMAWWGTLTEQFSNLASQAVAAGQEAMSAVTPVVPEAKAAKASAPRKAASSAPGKKASTGHHADDAQPSSPPARKTPRR
jgi:hypothetical protein